MKRATRELSASELGRRGAAAVAAKYGPDHLVALGYRGGAATAAKGSAFYRRIGALGSEVTIAKGKEFLRERGRKSAAACKQYVAIARELTQNPTLPWHEAVRIGKGVAAAAKPKHPPTIKAPTRSAITAFVKGWLAAAASRGITAEVLVAELARLRVIEPVRPPRS